MAGDDGLTRTTMTMKPEPMFVPAAQPTDLPIAEAGAQRHRGPKTQKLGFELHKGLRSSH